jgi:hypothetical protein
MWLVIFLLINPAKILCLSQALTQVFLSAYNLVVVE